MNQPIRHDPAILEFIEAAPRSSRRHTSLLLQNLHELRDLADAKTEGVTPEQRTDLQHYVDWRFDLIKLVSAAEWSVSTKNRKPLIHKLADGDYVPEIVWRVLYRPKRDVPPSQYYQHFESRMKPRFVKPGDCHCGCRMEIHSYAMAELLYKMHCLSWKLDRLVDPQTWSRRLYLRLFDLKTTAVLAWHNFKERHNQ